MIIIVFLCVCDFVQNIVKFIQIYMIEIKEIINNLFALCLLFFVCLCSKAIHTNTSRIVKTEQLMKNNRYFFVTMFLSSNDHHNAFANEINFVFVSYCKVFFVSLILLISTFDIFF